MGLNGIWKVLFLAVVVYAVAWVIHKWRGFLGC